MEKGKYWDFGRLAQALAASEEVQSGRMTVEILPPDGADGAGVIKVTLHDCGDLDVVVGVSGQEIQASALLNHADEIPDRAGFERRLLKTHKLLSLSTFGITELGGDDYYEIFGQLSGGSEFEEIIEEIETLGRNALDAAEMIAEWKSTQAAA